MQEKISMLNAKLDADNNLAEKLFALETPEEVQSLLKQQGIDFTIDEINTLRNDMVAAAQKGELSEAQLEGVAGGLTIVFKPQQVVTNLPPDVRNW